MRNYDLKQLQEYYRVAMLLYDMGNRPENMRCDLSRYYSPIACKMILRMMNDIREQEQAQTEEFMKNFHRAESVIHGKRKGG